MNMVAATRSGIVLLVDNEPARASVLSNQLTEQGFAVDLCADGQEALYRLRSGRYEVVVAAPSMGAMDAPQLVQQLREFDSDLPVVIASDVPQERRKRESMGYGVTLRVECDDTPTEMLRSVQRAVQLYRLGKAKRSTLSAMRQGGEETWDSATLMESFERALGSLWVAFQPIVQVKSRRVYGYEALLRSREPLLPHPGAVLEAAERLGALRLVGRRIRKLALEALFQDGEPSRYLFLNLHADDLCDEQLFESLHRYPEAARRLVFELTERASLDGISDVSERIAALRRLGARIAVDDLGTGYAGLSSFVQLEPDIVKLDMSLVRDADKSPLKQRLIGSLTQVCNDMGCVIVAEGIETPEERDTVVRLNCHLVQGYRFGKPLPRFAEANW